MLGQLHVLPPQLVNNHRLFLHLLQHLIVLACDIVGPGLLSLDVLVDLPDHVLAFLQEGFLLGLEPL